jgi:hypothetical protein
LASAAIATILLCVVPGRADRGPVVRSYVAGPQSDFGFSDAVSCEDPPDPAIPWGAGAVCFPTQPGESSVRVDVADATGLDVVTWYYLVDREGHTIGGPSGLHCSHYTIPFGSDVGSVWINVSTTYWPLECAFGRTGPATTGTVTATFS